MSIRKRTSASLALLGYLALVQSVIAQTQFTETWESYSSGATPYGDWQLGSGTGFTWVSISTPGLGGSGKCYLVAAGQKSRIVRPLDLDSNSHVVLQGWLYDSTGGANRSVLGLGSSPNATDLTLIRFGAGGGANYTIQHYEGGSLNTVDTLLPVEAGWHFLRLDIVYDGNPSNLWTVTWRIWNAARTVEKVGVFGWHFDRVNCNYVTLGAAAATPAAMAWDDIRVGSIADVGPPPFLPLGAWQTYLTVMASSEIPGWAATNAIDGNAGTVWSSTGHGTISNATEWLVVVRRGTHLHPDHVGWNTMQVDGRWVPTFPNARYIFSARDWEWLDRQPVSPLGDYAGDSVRPVIEAGLAELVTPDFRFTDEVWLESTPGHRPATSAYASPRVMSTPSSPAT